MSGCVVLLSLSMIFAGCKKSDDNNLLIESAGDVLMSVLISNPDGSSGSAYMQIVDGITPATYSNNAAIPCYFGLPPFIYGSNVYVMPAGNSDVVTKYKAVDGSLIKQWQINVPDGSNANNIVENGNEAYMVFVNSAKIRVIKTETGETVKDIDMSGLAYTDNNPDLAAMVVRDNELYVAMEQAAMYNIYPYQDYKTVEVAIVDLSDYSIKGVAKQSTANMSNPTKNVNYNSIFVDENNDVYVTCNGSFGMYADHRTGILRIKNGSHEFDPDYIFDLKEMPIANDGNAMSYFGHMTYAGNGILYASVHVPAYESASGYNPLSDRSEMAVEINLYNKTITSLDLPRSNGFAGAVGLYDEYVVFGVASTTDNGFYTYNTKTKEKSSEAIIKTTGYPYIFRRIR